MTSEQFRQRADILGTQIITRNTGKRLGVVSQLWVDVDRREVVAIGFRENILSGVVSNTQQAMLLRNVRQVGDVILVEDDSVVEDDLDVEIYSTLINSEVVTETGDLLGKVRGFKFNVADGQLESLVIASLGYPFIPDQVVSTYELSIEEVVSSGPDRLIVFEGSEQKMVQLSVGFLERIGIGRPIWERDDEEYIMPVSTSNQLPTGVRTPAPQSMRSSAPARETWDDDTWEEQPARRPLQEPLRQRQPEPVYYDEPTDNWSEPRKAQYTDPYDKPSSAYPSQPNQPDDVWEDDDNPKPYRAPQVNLPDRKKVVEYEDETEY